MKSGLRVVFVLLFMTAMGSTASHNMLQLGGGPVPMCGDYVCIPPVGGQ